MSGYKSKPVNELMEARRSFERNKARIESGETYRSQKGTDWRPGKSPSSYGTRSRH